MLINTIKSSLYGKNAEHTTFFDARLSNVYFYTFITLFFIFLFPTALHATTCSEHIGKASINEVYELGNKEWVEVKMILPTTSYSGWKLKLCNDANPEPACGEYPLGSITLQNGYYLVTEVDKKHFNIKQNGKMDIILLDNSNNAVDYLSINNFTHQQPTCNNFIYDTSYSQTSSNSKGIFRGPDGTGDWDELAGSGATGTPTDATTNDQLDENSIVVSLANITVQPGQPAIFDLELRDHEDNLTTTVHDVILRYQTFDGDEPNSAIAAQDYEETYGEVTIPAGQSTAQISVNTYPDADYDTYFYLLITRALQANGDPVYPQPSYSIATFAEPDVSLIYIQLTHPATGLTCAPSDVVFTACADENCTEQYTGGVEFTLTKNGIAYTNIIIPENTSSTVRGVTHTVAGTVTLGISNIDPEATGDPLYQCDPANCQIAFADTGFRLVDSSGTPASYSTQIAGKASDVTPHAEERFIQAVRTDDQSGACTGIFDDGENVAIDFAAECIDPSACTSDASYNMQLRDYTNSLTTIATTDTATAWSSVTLTFGTNSMAPLPLMYPDVGQMQLHARYNLPDEEGDPSGDYMQGSFAPFVVRPYDFTFTNPTCETNHTDFFCRAGEGFTVDITAVNFNGDTTPNFGNESSAQVVTLEHQLESPTGGVDGAIAHDPDTLNFINGVASGVSMSWNEVGELALRGKMDGYLGSAAFDGNSWSDPIGRFTPYYFDLDIIGLPNEVYMGAPMSLQLITTARNMGGGTTQNYFGAYDNMGDIADRLEITIQGADAAMNSRLRFDPDDVLTPDPDWNNGVATYSIDLFFDRLDSGPDGPHDLTLLFGLCDGDDICAQADASTSGPVIYPDYPDTLTARYARMVVGNAHGSELLGTLTLPMRVEYYQDGSWLLDSALNQDYFDPTDPVIDVFDFEAIQGPLAADDLEVALAIGMASGAGEVTIEQNISPKKQGSVYVIPNVPAWLQYDWDGDGVYNDPPRGRATFGIYQGSDRKIYMRELY